MARIIKIGLAALAVTVGTLAVSVATNGINQVHAAEVPETAGVKTATITSADLKNTPFEDYEIVEGKHDKKFRISLPDDKYINGCIVFRDCGHQFVGSTLGDAFGIDNTYSGAPKNAYNFNILFSFEHVTKITVDFRAIVSGSGGDEHSQLELKYASLSGEFYQGLINLNNYNSLTLSTKMSGTFYNRTKEHRLVDPFTPSQGGLADSQTLNLPDTNYNIAAMQFTYSSSSNYVNPGNKISFILNSLSFNYTCN